MKRRAEENSHHKEEGSHVHIHIKTRSNSREKNENKKKKLQQKNEREKIKNPLPDLFPVTGRQSVQTESLSVPNYPSKSAVAFWRGVDNLKVRVACSCQCTFQGPESSGEPLHGASSSCEF